jgi:hypothetical protein
MPEQGIAALFNKEAGDEVEGEEVEEEVEVKDTRTKKEIVLDALRKARRGRGNYSSPDAEGPAVSGRGSVIRGLEDAGKVDKGLKDKPYKKSKFNWKRFTRNKADGGRIGFEVGGLSSQAQGIYDSWIAAGHTEEDVLAYLTSQGLYGAEEPTGIQTIVNTQPIITQGGGGGGNGGGGDEDSGYAGLGMSPGALGGKLPGVGNWGKRALGDISYAYSKIPSITKAFGWAANKISDWNDVRKEKKAAELAAELAAAKKAAGYDLQGNWTSPSGRDHAGSGGIGSAASRRGGAPGTSKGEGSFKGAYGGRVGYTDGGLATMFQRRR